MKQALAALVAIAVIGAAVTALAAATQAQKNIGGTGRTRAVFALEIVREPLHDSRDVAMTLVGACVLDVTADVVQEPRRLREETFVAVLAPALSESEAMRFHGCLEDARLDHVQADVLQLESSLPDPGSA